MWYFDGRWRVGKVHDQGTRRCSLSSGPDGAWLCEEVDAPWQEWAADRAQWATSASIGVVREHRFAEGQRVHVLDENEEWRIGTVTRLVRDSPSVPMYQVRIDNGHLAGCPGHKSFHVIETEDKDSLIQENNDG
eukprot:5157669-Prymnesium_polylepis.1